MRKWCLQVHLSLVWGVLPKHFSVEIPEDVSESTLIFLVHKIRLADLVKDGPPQGESCVSIAAIQALFCLNEPCGEKNVIQNEPCGDAEGLTAGHKLWQKRVVPRPGF